jgi:hypothetical protein
VLRQGTGGQTASHLLSLGLAAGGDADLDSVHKRVNRPWNKGVAPAIRQDLNPARKILRCSPSNRNCSQPWLLSSKHPRPAPARAAFENPKVAAHGDFACTAAMQLAKPLKANPRALGEQLKAALEGTAAFQQWVDAIEIAGPGFLNIRLKPAAKQEVVREVLAQAQKFGYQADRGENILVEFVSANPTGPLHVGHGRQAAIGDAISNLYSTQGWKVHREFYYNDAGVQIDTLTKSTQLRARASSPVTNAGPPTATTRWPRISTTATTLPTSPRLS